MFKTFLTSLSCAWLLLAVAACDRRPLGGAPRPRVAMIVAPADFDDQEYSVTRSVLERGGARVTLACTSRSEAVSHAGMTVRPDLAIRELSAGRLDAVVIVGGMGAARHLWDNADLRALVIDADRRKKVVAAICLAPGALARAGVLAGRKATCYPDPAVVAEIRGRGAEYLDAPVVAAGKVITGSGPQSASEFGAKILAAVGARAAGPAP